MSRKPTSIQQEAQEAVQERRPPLDAIAEDLVTQQQEPPKPAPKAKVKAAPDPEDEPTPDDVGEDEDPQIDYTPDDDGDEGDDFDDDDPIAAQADDEEEDFLSDLSRDGDEDDLPEDSDEQVYRVKVDGEEREVSLTELLRNYSAEGAIDKRLQEATEARNAARQEAEQETAMVRDLAQRLNQAYQHYNTVLFAPKVPRPDPAMQNDDPIGYLNQMEAFRQDQERIRMEQGQLQQVLHQAQQMEAANQQQYLSTQASELKRKLPGLKNPDKAKVFRSKIAAVGQRHGFSPEEIAQVGDHRLLTLAADAAAYHDLKARLEGKKTPKATTKRRPMPTRGDNRQKGEVSRKQSKKRKVISKARETGAIDDVAATLLI